MTTDARNPALPVDTNVVETGLHLQEEGLRLLFAEIRALQAMIPVGDHELPTDAEVEESFDNMPV